VAGDAGSPDDKFDDCGMIIWVDDESGSVQDDLVYIYLNSHSSFSLL